MFFDDPFSKGSISTSQQDFSNSSLENSNDFIEFETFSEYEVDDPSSMQSSLKSGNYEVAVNSQQPLNHLMFISMLEHICSLYADNENSSEELFKAICQKLKNTAMIPELKYLDDFKAVRMKYQTALKNLIEGTLEIKHAGSHSLQPEDFSKFKSVAATSFSTHSWYKDMFSVEDEVHVADGGFGKVVKSKNKLDHKHYAIKKIPLIDTDLKKILKTLREVQIFSDLDHVNIVRYHSSWLEHSTDVIKAVDLPPKNISHSKKEAAEDVQDLVRLNTPNLLSGGFGFDVSSAASQVCHLQKTIMSGGLSEEEQRFLKHKIESIHLKKNSSPKNQTKIKLLKMTLFIQMEICNKTLWSWLHQRNKDVESTSAVDKCVASNIFHQILLAIQYIHRKGLMHRDLKPANVFLVYKDEEIVVKVGDFGLARYHPSFSSPISPVLETSSPFDFTSKVGEHTAGVGTTTYAAPEQMKNSSYTNKVDIWSLGIILFELFRPFSTEMERGVLIRDLLHKHAVCKQMEEKWPVESRMVKRMSLEEPDDRPDASELLKILSADDKEGMIADLKNQVEAQQKEIANLQRLIKEQLCTKCKAQC